jgi:hypothetical protein
VTRYSKRGPVTGVSKWQTPPAGWSREKWAAMSRDERRHAHAGGRRMDAHRTDSAAAQRAGDCGRSAPPLGYHQRIDSYHRQNGAGKLTPKQQRRANKKLKLELVAAAVYGTEAGVSL